MSGTAAFDERDSSEKSAGIYAPHLSLEVKQNAAGIPSSSMLYLRNIPSKQVIYVSFSVNYSLLFTGTYY